MIRDEALSYARRHELSECDCPHDLYCDSANGFLEGYAQGVSDSVNLLPSIRRFLCKCKADVCPRVVAIQDNLLTLLEKKPEQGGEVGK